MPLAYLAGIAANAQMKACRHFIVERPQDWDLWKLPAWRVAARSRPAATDAERERVL